MTMPPLSWAPIGVACGVALHLLYFYRGEHHLYGVKYLQVFVISLLASFGTLAYANGITLASSLPIVSFLAGSLLLGLLGSILCHRLIWHPLRGFPGAFPARISSLWLSTQNAKGHNNRLSLALYNKYDPFVRIGSSDLMIVHPNGIPAVHGAQSKCRKASRYDLDFPRQSIQTTRDHKQHHERRRIWSPAFSDRALRGYEGLIALYNNALIERLAGFEGRPANVSRWFNYYSFDLIGNLSFGRDFGMLKSGEEHWVVALMNEAFDVMRLVLPSWIPHIVMAIPGVMKNHWKFIDYCNHLNAVISEALRLHPPVPSQTLRQTPPEGIRVGGTFIPGNMTVWTPLWVLGRAEAAYEKPHEFIPERWYSRPSLVRDSAAYAPFLTGPFGCIGRPLAQMQLRAITAQLVMRFDIEFPPGVDGSAFIENSTDRFSWGLADLYMCFKPRA